MKFIRLLSSLLLATAAQLTFASDECSQYKSSYDQTFCMAKLFVEADKELNAVYKDLQTNLNADTKKALTLVQRDWIKYRNQACEKLGDINAACNYQVNKARTEYMRDRLRECRAGTCRADQVAKKSWD